MLVAAAVLVCAPLGVSAVASAAEPTKDECIDASEAAQGLSRSRKLVEAKQRLLVCVSPGCPGPVRDDCTQSLADVQAKTPTLVFVATDEAEHDLSAVRVTIDGSPFVDRLDGTAVPVDPGEHQFVFEASGLAKEQRTIVVHEGEKNRRERVVLVPPGPASSPASAPAAPAATSAGPPGPAAAQPLLDGRTQRMVGLALGGAGAAGVVVGGIFGVISKATYDNALGECRGGQPTACSARGIEDGRSAHTQALVSTVGFVGGAVLLGGGAFLYFTAPRGGDVSVGAAMAPGGATIGLRGRW